MNFRSTFPSTFPSAAAVLLTASISSAADAIISEHSFEGSSGGTETLIEDMDFRGHYGDQNLGGLQIIDDAAIARTGTRCVSMALESGEAPDGAAEHGFGGCYLGAQHAVDGGLAEDSRFEISAWMRADPSAPLAGEGKANIHFELWSEDKALIRSDSLGLCPEVDASLSSKEWEELVHRLQIADIIGKHSPELGRDFTEDDLASVKSVRAIITADTAANTGKGRVLVDDFRFAIAGEE